MRLKMFNERDNAELHQDVAKGLSKTEQRLCNYFSRVEITGKRGRKVAVLLSPSMLDALSLLVSKRTECGVCSTNVFLFARPKCMSYYRGQDCLRLHASKCGAKPPEHLRSTHLRKHVATLSQVLNLKNNELDQVADFLGHDIRVHRNFYRLPVPTTQLAKISKLLLTMEKGQLSSIQGKSLDEIDIGDEISFSDAEDVNSDSDDDETAAPATECGTSQPVTAASTSVITEQDIDHLAETVSSTVSETAPPYEGKDHENARRTIKKLWAKNEVAAVMRHFKLHIAKRNLATKSECHHCKLVEGKVLDERTVQNVRDFVRNRGIARKRQSQ
ncbi:Cyanuric acid amidohydrolase [Dissostichus eleginoides]|uniref:Cyanuric acid amidohydrolase n=1 Tax=Dissostichus eleginoides TaxID=100907 RepID=A0AAD9CP05_DISEL|nr:Cyanuric acid amidohydrolase [Dissostichus eleginoides]